MKKRRLFTVVLSGIMVLSAMCSCTSKDDKTKKEGEKYIIATDSGFAPFAYENTDGKIEGIDIELFEAIADNQKINFEYQHLTFEGACAALESGQADGAMNCLSIKEERKLKYDFSDPYYTSSVVVVVKKDSGIDDFSDLNGKVIASKIATDGERYANDLADEYGAKSTPVEDFSTSFMMLSSGNVDAIVEDITVSNMAISKDDSFVIVGNPGYEANIGFAVKKDENAELLKAFNDGLKNIKANGKYDEIMKKYLG